MTGREWCSQNKPVIGGILKGLRLLLNSPAARAYATAVVFRFSVNRE